MAESWNSRCWRWLANLSPAYSRTGATITYIAHNFQEVHVALPLNWKTRNYMNMIWGGSLYGAIDPIYGVMLWKLLGPRFDVVNKAATIHFRRPGRATLHARFVIDDAELQSLHIALRNQNKLDRHYQVELLDSSGSVHMVCEKTVHNRRR